MIYIFDLDGTLADLTHRLPLIQAPKADWRAFFKACPRDVPIVDVITLLQQLWSATTLIFIVSGRSDEVRLETEAWLSYYRVPHTQLFMRRAGDYRPDTIVKSELLDEISQRYPLTKIAGVFEDRASIVKMYRERGLRVFQVAEGDF